MWIGRASLSMMVAVCAMALGCSDEQAAATGASSASSAPGKASAVSSGKDASGGTTAPSEPKKPERKPLRDLLVGSWLYESVEMPGVPAGAKKQIDAELKKSSLEFTDKKFTSLTNGKVFSSADYEIVEEKGNDLTIKLTKAKKNETYTFVDDNTISFTDKELGKTVLKRKS